MIRSFRFRLTVWYVALFSLLFVLFSIFLHGLLSKDLRTRLDQSLTSEASTAAALFEDELVEEKGDVPMAATEAVAGLRLHGSRVAILSGSRLLASSGPVSQQESDAVVAQAARNASPDLVLALPQLGPNGARAATHRLTALGRSFLIFSIAPLDSIAADLGVVRRVHLPGAAVARWGWPESAATCSPPTASLPSIGWPSRRARSPAAT